IEQRLLVLRQAKVVTLLLQAFDFVATGWTFALNELALGYEDLVDGAVPAFVVAFVDIAVDGDAAPEFLRGPMMARLGRPDEIVVRDVQISTHLSKAGCHLFGENFRFHSSLPRRAFDLLTVFIRSRQKEHVIAEQPSRSCDGVSDHRRIRMPDVRLGVDVVDGRRDVERIHGRRVSSHAFVAAAWISLTLLPVAFARRTQSSNSGAAFSASTESPAILDQTRPTR